MWRQLKSYGIEYSFPLRSDNLEVKGGPFFCRGPEMLSNRPIPLKQTKT